MHTIETVLLVLMLGAVSGILARYVRAVPLPLIQIAIGALLSWPQRGLHIQFNPNIFLLLFIPPLLFADGWRIPKREFFALARPILMLALGLVLFTVIGLGYFVHWMIPAIPLPVAFALAAVVSPTDAVAVSAITRNLGMPPKTMHILEGESLLNDASGLVALKFAVLATVTGSLAWQSVAKDFVWMAVGGVAVGALLGWLFALVREAVSRRLGDLASTQLVLLLVLLPFAAYLVGEKIAVSGILAAVAAGVATNFADLNRDAFVRERLQTESVWTLVESSFNGAIFLLLGIQLPSIIGDTLVQVHGIEAWRLVGYVVVLSTALLLLRWLWITFGVHASLMKAHRHGKLAERPSQLLTLATTLAGIRGAVTLAAALSIPLTLQGKTPFPARELVIFLATGTILFTLVLASIGLPLILRRLPKPAESETGREERLARLAACDAALASLVVSEADIRQHSQDWLAMHQDAAGQITREYRSRMDVLRDSGPVGAEPANEEAALAQQHKLQYVMELELRLHCVRQERTALYAERHAHRINDESLRSLVAELDLNEITIRKRLHVAQLAAGMQPDAPLDLP
ncbi:Na+/H+ antiporter [Comamonas serinivorans]|uniref:Na+/H+ antiporter n=1 Tax=Comamonas serinivorans TaxID=1082851 RepID=A0A1Y0EK61_9BURK|nr:Na+/H+ antiporter [Comamonas serinivorans]ARU03749.1 Na+/H+ antiporter [Comamonas serinivorans]